MVAGQEECAPIPPWAKILASTKGLRELLPSAHIPSDELFPALPSFAVLSFVSFYGRNFAG